MKKKMMRGSMLPSIDVRLTYEVIRRVSNFILIIYKNDFVLGSLALDSEPELDEWKERMAKLEISIRE